MFRHNVVSAIRSLAYHRLYSIINVAGLSVGLAAAILIALHIRDELSYDGWIPDGGNLYRLEATFHFPGRDPEPYAMASFPVVTAIREKIPQVKEAIHVQPQSMTVNLGDQRFRERITFVDPRFLQVIKLPLAVGDPARVLAQPESVVLSERAARKYFGSVDPIGKTLSIGQDQNSACDASDAACLSKLHPLVVTGVLRDVPYNTQFVADVVVPNTSQADAMSAYDKTQSWTSLNGVYGYLELVPGADLGTVLAQLKEILDQSFDPRRQGIDLSAGEFEQYQLTPLRDVHLTSDRYRGMTPGGSWTAVYGLGAVALLIVLIASCNVTNLATARATLRAREIAVRKVGGASRKEIIAQFLVEAVLFGVVSFVLALVLVELTLPAYGRFLGRPVALHYIADWELFAALVAGAISVGLASGLYPAIALSRLRPVQSLKPHAAGAGGTGWLRSALIVVQFAISIGLGIAALVVVRQIEFARSVDLGFDRNDVVIVRGVGRLTPSARESLAAVLRTSPHIVALEYSNAVPLELSYVDNDAIRIAGDASSVPARIINIGPDFPSLFGMKLLAGRLLSGQGADPSTRRSLVRNMLASATAVQRLGLSAEEAIGKTLTVGGRYSSRIVGVLSDVKLQGVRDSLQPALYYLNIADPRAMRMLSIRIRGERAPEALSFIDQTWRSLVPGAAIDRYYLSDEFDRLIRPDEKQGQIMGLFVGVAICIACLGLIGLAIFTAERRTKEIGIRKIAGARTFTIVNLMLWRISVPVLAANLIAWPLAYYYLTPWLENYAYRVPLSPAYFLAGALVALVAAWATVLSHTLRLARASPIHALRHE